MCTADIPDSLQNQAESAIHSTDYAVVRCLSVSLSVYYAQVMCQNGYIDIVVVAGGLA